MDPLRQQGAVGGTALSFSTRKNSETDKEEGKGLKLFQSERHKTCLES